MTKMRMNPNQPKIEKDKVQDITEWDIDVNKDKIPYVSHAPENPMKMTKTRKTRIKKILSLKEKNPGITPEEIAEKLGIPTKYVKRDLTTALVLAKENLPYLPPQDKALLHGVIDTYNTEAQNLFVRIKGIITILEDQKSYLDPKGAMSFAMLLSELRQTLELGAKLSGELQVGTKVNVIVFSGMVKRIIEIISQEVDRQTFLRIRERLRLEMQGQTPLGDKGGIVQVDNE